MVENDIHEGPRWLLGLNPPALNYFSGLLFNNGASVRLVIRIAQVEFAVMTALNLKNFAFYVVEDDFGLDENLMMLESILMYVPPAVVVEIDDLGLLKIVQGSQFFAATSIVAFERLRDLHWSSTRLAFPSDGSPINMSMAPSLPVSIVPGSTWFDEITLQWLAHKPFV